MTTLMGQKKSPNATRKPMKRSYMKRGKPLKRGNSTLKRSNLACTGRTHRKAPSMAQRDEAFLRPFRGLPCAVCGRTWFLRDERGNKIKTCGHHLLEKSTHPEYRMTKENILPLCGKHHISFAHDQKNEFMAWLEENRPEVLAWVEAHNHHIRKERKTPRMTSTGIDAGNYSGRLGS